MNPSNYPPGVTDKTIDEHFGGNPPETFEQMLDFEYSGDPEGFLEDAREICWQYIQAALKKAYRGDIAITTALKRSDIK